MGMIQPNFSDEDRQILGVERFEHPHPRVQRKMEAVCLTRKASHGARWRA